jgi:hypothetical protein
MAAVPHQWTATVRYRAERWPALHGSPTGAHTSRLAEFAGESWDEWVHVVLESSTDGAEAVDAGSSSDSEAVATRFSHGEYASGLLTAPMAPSVAKPMSVVRDIARDFEDKVEVEVRDDLDSEPTARVSESLVDASGNATERMVVPEQAARGLVPNDMLSFVHGVAHTGYPEHTNYVPVEREAPDTELFPQEYDFTVDATAARLSVDPGQLVLLEYVDLDACYERGRIETCDRFRSVAHEPSGIPLDVVRIDIDGGVSVLEVTDASFSS